jgi:hypothetical protein
MSTILKFFFYAVALVTLAWVRNTPAESVTMIEWVRFVQSPNWPFVVFLVTAALFLINLTLTGSFIGSVSKVNTHVAESTSGQTACSSIKATGHMGGQNAFFHDQAMKLREALGPNLNLKDYSANELQEIAGEQFAFMPPNSFAAVVATLISEKTSGVDTRSIDSGVTA